MIYLSKTIKEIPLTLVINNKEEFTLLCHPSHLKALVVGYLYANYYIQGLKDLEKVIIDEEKGMCYIELVNNQSDMNHRYITSGCVDSAVFHRMMDAVTHRPSLKTDLNESQKIALERAVKSLDVLSAVGWSEHEQLIVKDIYPVNRIYKLIGQNVLGLKRFDFIIIDEHLTTELLIACMRNHLQGICYQGYISEKAMRISEKIGMVLIRFDESGNIFVQG